MSAPDRIGRYRIDRRVGSGGFATVWLARDEVLDAPVAVKVLADNWAHQLDVRERFLEEARILRRADSDRIVRVHDIGELEDGRPYFVMTYADGGTLADRIAAGPVTVPDALRYGADVARGLAVLHEVGVIHRDVNPANVLLRSGRDGFADRVLVADLGLAKVAAHGSGFTLTVGTPGYMAPEQSTGDGVSKRADVYAVGALLHHLISGSAPVADTPLPPLPPDVPDAVDAVVRQAVRRRPEERYPSAGALADALDAALIASSARPAPTRPRGTSARAGGAAALVAPEAPGRSATGGSPAGGLPAGGGSGAPRGRREPVDESGTERLAVRPPERPREPAPVRGAPPAREELPVREAEPDDTMFLRPLSAPRRRRGVVVALVGVVLLLLAAGAGAVAWRIRTTGTVEVGGQVATVTVPRAWAGQRQDGVWDLTPYGVTGSGTSLVVAQDVARWREQNSASPGVFVGVGKAGVPETKLREKGPAAACDATEDPWSSNGLTGTVRHYQRCGPVTADVVEAVLQTSDKRTVYVQIKGAADRSAADQVLSSVRIGPVS